MTNSRLETYNYYNDSRVQAAMMPEPCWRVTRQGKGSATVAFEKLWIEEAIYEPALRRIVDGWVEAKVGMTLRYRSLSQELLAKKENKQLLRKEFYQSRVHLSVDQSERLAKFSLEIQQLDEAVGMEFSALRDVAESENSFDDFVKNLGFEAVTQYSKDGDSEDVLCMNLQSGFEVCPLCEGHGTVVNPSIDCCGLTFEDFDEDPDFAEDYMSGRYNIPCTDCKGLRVKPEVQFPDWLKTAVEEFEQDQWNSVRERCAELSMGA